MKLTAIVSTILLSAALAAPAQAAESGPKRGISVERLTTTTPVVTVAPDAAIDTFDMQAVTSVHIEPVAVVEAPVVQVAETKPGAPVPAPAPTYTPAAPAPAPTQTYAAPAPVQTYAAPQAAGSGGGAGLLASAYSQLGIQQDCTRMVENALASIGRPVGDLGPSQFLSVGTIVGGPAQPGDILVYGGHVAIAVDSTTAIHGGFNGGTTGVGPIDVGQGSPTIVRV